MGSQSYYSLAGSLILAILAETCKFFGKDRPVAPQLGRRIETFQTRRVRAGCCVSLTERENLSAAKILGRKREELLFAPQLHNP